MDLPFREAEARHFPGIGVRAEAGIGPKERRGAVGLFALEAEFLLYLIADGVAFLVESVVFFPHAVGRPVRQGDRDFQRAVRARVPAQLGLPMGQRQHSAPAERVA